MKIVTILILQSIILILSANANISEEKNIVIEKNIDNLSETGYDKQTINKMRQEGVYLEEVERYSKIISDSFGIKESEIKKYLHIKLGQNKKFDFKSYSSLLGLLQRTYKIALDDEDLEKVRVITNS